MINRIQPWQDQTFVAFDLETSGKYPLEAEICEIAAVKWRGGQVIDRFQSLVKTTRPMSDEVINIHHITNEMLANAPEVKDVIVKFHQFLGDAILIAHHAPFDMGFLACEFERYLLSLPAPSVLCTALLSRKALPTSPNHRLQTLIQFLGLPQGQAHRALDDAEACLQVALRCFTKIGENAKLEDIYKFQATELKWTDYSLERLAESEAMMALISSIQKKTQVEMVYKGGSRPGQPRVVVPVGIVCNPQGNFLVAREPAETQTKRFFLSQIVSARTL